MHSQKNTIILAIIACLLWSSAFAGVKVGLQYNQPLQFAGTRFFISGILLIPLAVRSGNYLQIVVKNFRFIMLVSALHVFILYALFYNGLNLVPGAVGAIVVGSGPLFIALLSHFFMDNDRLKIKKVLVMLLGFSGIVLVSLGRSAMDGETSPLLLAGVLILLTSNTVGGLANVVIAKGKGKVPSLILSSSSLTIGGLILFLMAVPLEGINTGPFPNTYWIALSWLSFLSAAAISIWFSLLKRPGIRLSSLNMWKFIIPVSGAVLSWIILKDEHPDPVTITGMVITGLSLILLTRVDKKEKTKTKKI